MVWDALEETKSKYMRVDTQKKQDHIIMDILRAVVSNILLSTWNAAFQIDLKWCKYLKIGTKDFIKQTSYHFFFPNAQRSTSKNYQTRCSIHNQIPRNIKYNAPTTILNQASR